MKPHPTRSVKLQGGPCGFWNRVGGARAGKGKVENRSGGSPWLSEDTKSREAAAAPTGHHELRIHFRRSWKCLSLRGSRILDPKASAEDEASRSL